MKPPSTAVAALGLAGLLLAAPGFASVRYTEQSDRTFEAKGLKAVAVENSRGDVVVSPSPDGLVHVTALKTCRGRDQAEARSHAREISVAAGVQGDRCVVSVRYPKHVNIQVNLWDLFSRHGDSEDWGPQYDVKLLVQVPPALALQLESASGDLTSRGLAGRQVVHSTSGDVVVEAAGGAVDLRTASGDIKLRSAGRGVVRSTSGDIDAACGGPLDARTASGDIEIPSAGDTLLLGSTSGDITVEDSPRCVSASTASGGVDVTSARGSVTLGSTSGAISVGLRAPFGGASLGSTSGDVEVDLAPGMDATLQLSTTSGDIESDVPVVLQGHGRQYLNAQYGRGGAIVKAQTVSGDLHVTSGGR